MRLVFLGSPEPVLSPLAMLFEQGKAHGHDLVGVVSQPAKPVGRKGELTDPPVAAWAKTHGIPTLQPAKAGEPEFLAALAALNPDVCITAAYGQLLPTAFLAIPRRATINIHPSLLPKYRGATPVPAALLDGATESGVSILFTVLKLDAGHLIAQEKTVIAANETSGALTRRYFDLGATMLFPALAKLADPAFTGQAQDEGAVTLCKKIKKTDGLVDWGAPATIIVNRFRAYEPWPGSFTFCAGRRLALTAMTLNPNTRVDLAPGSAEYDKSHQVLLIGTATEPVAVTKLKPAGGKEIDAASFWNGLKDKSRVVFTATETMT